MTTTVGIDEVGRGALFGPVCVGAVSADLEVLASIQVPRIKGSSDLVGVGDSKDRTKRQIQLLAQKLRSHLQVQWQIDWVSVEEIDELGLNKATDRAMIRCLRNFPAPVAMALVDGDRLIEGYPILRQKYIVGGDATDLRIGAGSIIAKDARDNLIRQKWHIQYRQYGLNTHVGYGTAKHIAAIRKYGLTPQHRAYSQSFLENRKNGAMSR